MDKKEIEALLELVTTPIYQIEIDLGMPKTTLQKAIKGKRDLPKRWALKLLEAYPPKKKTEVKDLNTKSNVVEPEKPKTSNFTINTSKVAGYNEILALAKSGAKREKIEELMKLNKSLTPSQKDMIYSKIL